MKILILADSLALPRPEGEGYTPYESTYPFILDRTLRDHGSNDFNVIERGMRRRTIENVLEDWYELVELRKPEVVVVHVGIVDCAPRVFLRHERDRMERFRPARVRVKILDFAHKHRKRIVQLRKVVYVQREQFAHGVNEVVERAATSGVKSLVFVDIISPPDEMEERSPGFQKNVETYNQILAGAAASAGVKFLALNDLVRTNGGTSKLTVDGIHLSAEGHQLLAHELEVHIRSLSETDTAASSTGG